MRLFEGGRIIIPWKVFNAKFLEEYFLEKSKRIKVYLIKTRRFRKYSSKFEDLEKYSNFFYY